MKATRHISSGGSQAPTQSACPWLSFIGLSHWLRMISVWSSLFSVLSHPAPVLAQYTYTTNNGSITITSYTGSGDDVTIPGSIDALPVTHIASQAFQSPILARVIIPDSVTCMARDAFSGCTRLSSLGIGSGLTNIGPVGVGAGFGRHDAFPFFGCFSLTNIAVDPRNAAYSSLDGVLFNKAQDTLILYPRGRPGGYLVPASVTSIGSEAFRECFSLQSVRIASAVTNIGDSAFFGCASLANVALPDSVTSIGNEAFSRCGALTRAVIPNSVTNLGPRVFSDCTRLQSVAFGGRAVGSEAFSGCSALKEIVFGSGVTSVGASAFSGCSGLTSVTLPEGLTDIGDYAFLECSGLKGLTLPPSVTGIGSEAFLLCTNLTSFTIPKNLSNLGSGAFESCTALTNITVDPQNPAYSSLEGVLFNKSQEKLIQCPAGKVGDFVVPASVTNIGWFAFEECGGLTNVTLPNSVTDLGNYSFLLCSGLRNVTIPDSVTSIGEGTFQASGLTSVMVPANVTYIWGDSFVSCVNLTNITVSPFNPAYSSLDGVLFDKSQARLLTFPAGKAGAYIVPDGVKNIGGAFAYGHPKLTSLAIPSSLTTIHDYEFQGCSGLTNITVDPQSPSYSSVGGVLFDKQQRRLLKYPPGRSGGYTMPNTVLDVAPAAFRSCTGLTSIVMSDNLISVASDSFWDCASLPSVTIPKSVTNLSGATFNGCTCLTNFAADPVSLALTSAGGVLFSKNQDTLVAYPPGRRGGYLVPEGVTRIEYEAFFGCSVLTSVAMPNSVTGVEADSFYGCSSLTNVVIGNGVARLPASAFDGCTALQSLFFAGDAPTWDWDEVLVGLSGTAYYLPGALGWGPTIGPLPTRLWNPQIQSSDGGFGVRTKGFGFNIAGTPDIPFVIEASSSLAAAGWVPLQTLTLTNGLVAFTDPTWMNWPSRFYRLRSP